MADSLSLSVESWGRGEEKTFLRLLGLRLEAGHVDGEPTAISDAVRALARELVTDERDADAFSGDVLNVGFFQDFFWDEHQPLIWVGSDRGLGFSDGVGVLDFGSGKEFAIRAPNEDMGRRGWLVLAVADRGDTEVLRSVVFGYIGQGWLPDNVSVAGLVSRADVEEAFTEFLDAGFVNDWVSLVAVLAELEPGSSFPIDTPDERAECLSAYLDIALSG